MTLPPPGSPVPAPALPAHFRARGIAFRRLPRIDLGFGVGQPQYCFMAYPLPGPRHDMGIFFEWHTEDFFESDQGPHLAVGIRGPVREDPHRGRGLAIGILAGDTPDPADPQRRIPLFAGCPPAPGGPCFFIEDFTINEGTAPIPSWQMTHGKALPQLGNGGVYRIDILVSSRNTTASIWRVMGGDQHQLVGWADCREGGPASVTGSDAPCPELPEDIGIGNAFIGTGFASPDTRSYVDNVYLAHWPEQGGSVRHP